ncbi:VanZ family protein [Alkalihalobacillus deserti]|uniref:VanZ family protein n=1 Tax=Alkalihalobacillus deserti TaxID=2879466 RepID=UPI001D152F91
MLSKLLKKHESVIPIKIFLSLSWMLLILVFSINSNFKGLIKQGDLAFSFTSNPDFSNLFVFYQFNSSLIIVQKAGHFLAFVLLTIFLIFCFSSLHKVFFIGLAYGLATEMIQPFFHRDGRILDVIINWSGVFLCVFVFVCIRQSVAIVESLKIPKHSEKV